MVFTDTASVIDLLGDWWEGHGWPRLPLDVLPQICALGVCGDRAVAAAFAYEPTPTVAWIDYMVTNPSSGLKGAISLKNLIIQFSDNLQSRGYKYIHSCCRQESLARLMEKSGYKRTDEGVTHFLKEF